MKVYSAPQFQQFYCKSTPTPSFKSLPQIVSKMEGEVVSRAIKIFDKKSNSFFDVVLTRDFAGGVQKECYFNLYTPDKRRIGTIAVMDTHPTTYEQQCNIPNMLEFYKDKRMKHKILELDYIENFNKSEYKNVGTQLVRVALQESINRGFNGHIVLRSVKQPDKQGVVNNISIPFFYRLGFRSNEGTNQKIESVFHNQQALNELTNTPFYLPDEKRMAFVQLLDKKPLFDSNFGAYAFGFRSVV